MKGFRFKITIIKYLLVFVPLIYFINNAIIFDKFTKWFVIRDSFDYVGLIAYMTAGLFLAIALFSLFAHRYVIKLFSIFIVISAAFATYFILKYSIAIDSSMILNVFYTDTTQSTALLSVEMIPCILLLIILPIIVILRTEIIFDNPFTHILKIIMIFIISLLICLALIYSNFKLIHRAGGQSEKYMLYQLVPVNVLWAIGGIAEDYIKDNFLSKKKVKVKIEGKVLNDDDLVVVLAIGETSRQKSFSLYGYQKNTNPLLSKQKDLHTLNGIATYGSTIYALPEILSRDDVKLPSITSAVGIQTSCFSNFQLYGNCGTVNEVMVSNCGHDGECYDEDVLPLLKEDLKSYKSGKRMVVLHFGGGSHGPIYSRRHPDEFLSFKPPCNYADVINKCTLEELYNSFDNSILYVDYVVSNAIDVLEASKVPYVFIFLSDHGESLLEDDRIFHGMPPGIALPKEQAEIPLLVKASVPISVSKRKEYHQQDIYDTVLDLLSIDIDLLKKDKVFIKTKGVKP